jgi:hypothetical protein
MRRPCIQALKRKLVVVGDERLGTSCPPPHGKLVDVSMSFLLPSARSNFHVQAKTALLQGFV